MQHKYSFSILDFIRQLSNDGIITSKDKKMLLKLCRRSEINTSEIIAESISSFIYQFNHRVAYSISEYASFLKALKEAHPIVQKIAIFALIHSVVHQQPFIENDIGKRRKRLKESVLDRPNSAPELLSADNEIIYQNFLMVYALMQDSYFADFVMNYGHDKLKMTSAEIDLSPQGKIIFSKEIPYILNTLQFLGQLPKIDLSPLQFAPQGHFSELLVTEPNSKIPEKIGIKPAEKYAKFQIAAKISSGNSDNTTAYATNGKKILFIRDDYSPVSIMASKIARRINPTLFSSERIMTSGATGSRLLPTYYLPLNAHLTQDKIVVDLIKEDKKVVPGMGIVDEVCSFVMETDPNIENMGISSVNLSQAFFCKIDFDMAIIATFSDVGDYQKRTTILENFPYCENDAVYQYELLCTRLELGMLTKSLLSIDADKCEFQPKDKEFILCELMKRSDMAIDLLISNQDSENIAKNMPDILSIYDKIINYFLHHDRKHLSQKDIIKIIQDITTRALEVLVKITLSLDPHFFLTKKIALLDRQNTYINLIKENRYDQLPAISFGNSVAQTSFVSFTSPIAEFYLHIRERILSKPFDNLSISEAEILSSIKSDLTRLNKYASYPVKLIKLEKILKDQLQVMLSTPERNTTADNPLTHVTIFQQEKPNEKLIEWLESILIQVQNFVDKKSTLLKRL